MASKVKQDAAEPIQQRRLKTASDHRFDPLDPNTIRDPGPAYSALAKECPFYHYEGDDYNFYITSDYKEIREKILSDNPF